MTQSADTAKHVIDGLSIGTLLGALVGWLPSIAAALTIVWTLIRIWESKTVQDFIKARQSRRK